MSATYTFDVFSSLDGFASHEGDWGGYWGKQGPEFLDHRRASYEAEQRLVLGATTYRDFVHMLGTDEEEPEGLDAWISKMRRMPATVVSNTLEEPIGWLGGASVGSGEAADVVARLKEDSELPLRSHGSLSLNRALMAAGLVDRVELTIFPVITGKTGVFPVFEDVGDFDLELIESKTFDGDTKVLSYRPTLH